MNEGVVSTKQDGEASEANTTGRTSVKVVVEGTEHAIEGVKEDSERAIERVG